MIGDGQVQFKDICFKKRICAPFEESVIPSVRLELGRWRGKPHGANEQGSIQELPEVWQRDPEPTKTSLICPKVGSLSTNEDNNSNCSGLKHIWYV